MKLSSQMSFEHKDGNSLYSASDHHAKSVWMTHTLAIAAESCVDDEIQ